MVLFVWGEGGKVRDWAVGRLWSDKSSAVNRISDIILVGDCLGWVRKRRV